MSIVYPDGSGPGDPVKGRMVDRVLAYRRLIGWRRWGMLQLYYRAGLSQQEIAGIFHVNRQMVTYEMKRAFDLVATHIENRRRYGMDGDSQLK